MDAAKRRGSKYEHDMTQGSIIRNLLVFAIPLLAGNLFQQLYNLVDTWVIGRTGDGGAYAAVGSVGPIINIIIGFFLGLASGAEVVISQYFGAKDEDSVRKTVHTSMVLTLILGVIFTILGVVMAPYMLKLMLRSSGDAEIYPFAKDYLTIYFAGVIGLMIYNMGSGFLRAVGDSRRPLYFLIFSALLNVGLDFLFVFAFRLGASGVAWATIISQGASALLVLFVLFRTDSCVKLVVSELRIDKKILFRIIRIGIPAAVQMALTAFANVFVQSYIANANGDMTVNLGGWTTYSKVDQFIFLPIQSLALATTTFVGQNLGKGNLKRAKKGTIFAYLMSTGASIIVITIVMLLASPISSIFVKNNPDFITTSTTLLHYITPFYLFCSVNQILSASLRGAGNATAPMIIMLSTFIGVRQIYLFVMSTFISNDLIPIGMGYPVGWFACASVTLIYFLKFNFKTVK